MKTLKYIAAVSISILLAISLNGLIFSADKTSCKCCTEECVKEDCCKDCGSMSGKAGGCCDNCKSEECKNACTESCCNVAGKNNNDKRELGINNTENLNQNMNCCMNTQNCCTIGKNTDCCKTH